MAFEGVAGKHAMMGTTVCRRADIEPCEALEGAYSRVCRALRPPLESTKSAVWAASRWR